MIDVSEQGDRDDNNQEHLLPPSEATDQSASDRQLTDEEKNLRQIIIDRHRLRARRRIAARSIIARHMGSMIYHRPDDFSDEPHSDHEN